MAKKLIKIKCAKNVKNIRKNVSFFQYAMLKRRIHIIFDNINKNMELNIVLYQ